MLRSLLASFYKRKSFLDPTNNYSKLAQAIVKNNTNKRILNIGAGDERLGEEVITLDLYKKADIKGDALYLPLKDQSFNAVLCVAVLEHLKEPTRAIAEMWRILKTGGEIYVEVPFLQPYHSSPNDYYRTTQEGLKFWLKDFKAIKTGVCVGPGSSVSWIFVEYIRLWFDRLPLIGLLVEIFVRLAFLPLKYLDKFIINRHQAVITSSAFYFYGEK